MTKDFETYVNMKERIDLILQRKFDSLSGFFNQKKFSFYRDVPDSSSPKDKVNITSTCFCALSILDDKNTERRFLSMFQAKKEGEPINLKKKIAQVLRKARGRKNWILEDNLGEDNHYNVYTASIGTTALRLLEPNTLNCEDIEYAKRLLDKIADDGAVRYGKDPPHAFLAYWCACALRLVIIASKGQKETIAEESRKQSDGLKKRSEELAQLEKDCFDGLKKLWNWTEKEVNKQIAYNASEEIDKFDAAQLAYSLAVLELLWNDPEIRQGLEGVKRPELGVLKEGVDLVFEFQRGIGLWPKFNHILHTQEQGSIYPFAFQMLDALLSIVDESNFELFEKHLDKLSHAIRWVEENKREYSYRKEKKEREKQERTRPRIGWGWRSNLLTPGPPQSWSTAAVFCAMAKLRSLLSLILNAAIKQEFKAIKIRVRNPQVFDEILDSSVPWQDEHDKPVWLSLKGLVFDTLISPRLSSQDYRTDKTIATSAFFYGPTGTRKTGLAKAIAYTIGWDFLKIQMSHFLAEGEQNVGRRATYIVEKLKHLERTVVIFDEAEELVRARIPKTSEGKEKKETAPIFSRLLTTCMLPLLEDLHDNREIIFIAITNRMDIIDWAAIREGRFDLLLRVGPPSQESKVRMMKEVYRILKNGGNGPKVTDKDIDWLDKHIKDIYDPERIMYILYNEWRNFLFRFFNSFVQEKPPARRFLKEVFNSRLRTESKRFLFKRAPELAKHFTNTAQYCFIPPTVNWKKWEVPNP